MSNNGNINELKESILNWNHENIYHLLSYLLELKDILSPTNIKIDEIIDFSALPSEPIPNGLEIYPIWALDKRGYCLTGNDTFSIEHIIDISDYYQFNQ